MTDWKRHTTNILSQLDLKTSKIMGQNFLIKPSVINKMIKSADLTSEVHVLEIGGGIGILTEGLVNTGASVTVIEKEKVLAEYLMKTYPATDIVNADALKVAWPKPDIIIANLPYSISSQILVKILHSNVSTSIVMVQKEVAERCIAQPGDRNYSRLAVICNMHSKVKKLFDVGPSAFHPRPNVTSSVIQFTQKHSEIKNSHTEIEDLVQFLFTLRRKTLRAALKGFLKKFGAKASVMEGLPLDDRRVYSLSIAELDQIVDYLKLTETWPITK